MRGLPSKQSSVLGIPVGPRRTDWARVGKLGAMGLGAISTAVGGVGAKRAGGRLKEKVTDEAEKGRETMEKVGQAAEQASSLGKTVRGPVSKVTSAVGALTGSSEEKGGDEGKDEGKDGGGDKNVKKLRLIIKEEIDVGVPLKTAYNQWTQFTEFPSIMKAPQKVDQEEDDETRWVAKIGPSRRRWTAKILEQVPDERIVWESTDGTENRGSVTFHRLDRNLTRLQVEMEYFPHGFVEKVGNVFLTARRRTRKDLRLYKHFLELAGEETGAWRGEITAEGEEQGADQTEGEEQGADQAESEGTGNGSSEPRDEGSAEQNDAQEDRRQASTG
jgi:uncharacterized membrane protein